MQLDNGALYVHLYLLLHSKVWCLPDMYLTHSWVNIFQVPQQDEMELCGCPGENKRRVSAAEVSIVLHGLSGDRFPGRLAAL